MDAFEDCIAKIEFAEPDKIDYFKEVPLGTGGVKFAPYLKALEEIGYRGFLTIEREVGDDPAADILIAKNYLKDIIANN